jgi:hypothetical protein
MAPDGELQLVISNPRQNGDAHALLYGSPPRVSDIRQLNDERSITSCSERL